MNTHLPEKQGAAIRCPVPFKSIFPLTASMWMVSGNPAACIPIEVRLRIHLHPSQCLLPRSPLWHFPAHICFPLRGPAARFRSSQHTLQSLEKHLYHTELWDRERGLHQQKRAMPEFPLCDLHQNVSPQPNQNGIFPPVPRQCKSTVNRLCFLHQSSCSGNHSR